MRSRSIVQVALLSLLTAAAYAASPTDDALASQMQVEFDASGLALREAMTLRAAGNAVEAAEAERSAQAHRARYLALRQRSSPTPAISIIRDPFSPDASWRVEAKASVAAVSTTRPRWDLYGLATTRERQGWDLYARVPSGDPVNREPDPGRAPRPLEAALPTAARPDAPDQVPPSAHQTSTVPPRETP